MLIYETGDLVEDSRYTIFCHQCNCFGKMGAGIAKQIAVKYPEIAMVDRGKFLNTDNPKDLLGTIAIVNIEKELCLRTCVNMYAQYHYGTKTQQTDYKAFQSCLDELQKYLETRSSKHKVGFPDHIGCGLAGGNWKIIRKMIEDFSKRVNQNVYIVKLTKGGGIK